MFWNEWELMKDPRFVEDCSSPGYTDYRATMSGAEALELAVRYSKSWLAWRAADRDALERNLRLAASDPETVVAVTVYEWASGYGD